jgi:tRNA(adenine34) deaminase
MKSAIEEAKKCTKDVPVGCVIKKGGEIISAAHNRRELDEDVTAHAEILALKEAQKKLKTSRLNDCEMYVTLEPCPMCAWAILQSGIKVLYFGSYNHQYGGMGSCENLPLINLANSKIKVYGGIEEEACDKILEDFFKGIR